MVVTVAWLAALRAGGKGQQATIRGDRRKPHTSAMSWKKVLKDPHMAECSGHIGPLIWK